MVTFRVTRYDASETEAARTQDFSVRVRKGMSVLEGLLEIQDRQDGSLALRYSCRGAVCGSCAMRIAGAVGLACRTQVESLHRPLIRVEPLPHLKVIKDLVVDLGPFFAKYEQIRPWLIPDGSLPERERRVSEAERRRIDAYVNCILCAACHGRCPVARRTAGYLSPAPLAKAYRFIADVRDADAERRLKDVDSHNGVWGCDTVFNCVRVCPKGVPPTHGICAMRRKIVARPFRRLVGR
jgi:succinate dehydrogenase / fumarate reductase iron-sulfur subunit